MKTKSSTSTARRTATTPRKSKGFSTTFADYRVKRSKGGVLWVSTDKTMDRDGEVVLPDGVVLEAFDKNPILLFGHDHAKPIGRVLDYTVGEERNTFQPEFAKSSAEAKTVQGLVEDGVLRATSIGFLPLALGEPIYENQVGNTYSKWELLEQSIVSVPSNRGALVAAAKRMKSVAQIADWFGMPEVEAVATKSGMVRGFRFEKVEDVLAFAKRHEEREAELAYAKDFEGTAKGTTQKSGEGEGHEHSFLVSIEEGEVTIGKTSEASGHAHDIKSIGVTEPGGEDGHVHEWALSPGAEEDDEETAEGDSSTSRSAKNGRQKRAGDEPDEDEADEDDGEADDDEQGSAEADEEEDEDTDFDLADDEALDEVIAEALEEAVGVGGR